MPLEQCIFPCRAATVCVLLVEDEAATLEIMANGLRDAGYGVVQAADCLQAVALLAHPPRQFTILVNDFNMHGLNRCRIAMHARRDFPGVPVIVTTGRPEAMRTSWLDDLGYILLRKPHSPSEPVGLVREPTGPPAMS